MSTIRRLLEHSSLIGLNKRGSSLKPKSRNQSGYQSGHVKESACNPLGAFDARPFAVDAEFGGSVLI